MSDQTLFEETPQEKPESIEDFVGEGKKYASVEEAAKANIHAQGFIEQLKRENEGMREDIERLQREAEKGRTLEEVEQRLAGRMATQKTTEESQGPSAQDIETLLETRIGERLPEYLKEFQSRQTAEQNEAVVSEQLRQRYGEKAKEALGERAKELGMSLDDMRSLAQRSPKAVLGLFPESSRVTPATKGSVNTEAVTGSGERSNQYYSNLRRENPKEYWSPRVQQQMFQDRKRLGNEFYK